nr:hypothetical protein [uncultured Acinetobacter sp.]
MNINEAFEYLQENIQNFQNDDKKIIGIAYTPFDSDADFYVIDLSIESPEYVEDGLSFIVSIEGGNISSSNGVDDYFCGEDITDLICELPEFAKECNYQIYTLENSPFGLQSEYALKCIFPQLPDPNDQDLSVFKDQAINLIASLNINKSRMS